MELIETPNVKITTIKAGATKKQTMSLKPVGLILLLSTCMKSKVIDFIDWKDFIKDSITLMLKPTRVYPYYLALRLVIF